MGSFLHVLVCVAALGLVQGQPQGQGPTNSMNSFKVYTNIRDQISNCMGQFVCEVTSPPPASFLRECKVLCVPWNVRCDGKKDCDNGADEVGCPQQNICAVSNRYTCGDGRTCADLCDGTMECPGGEDERGCPDGCVCPPGTYLCSHSRTCIQKSKICDGVPNCPAGDDEMDCAPEKCHSSQYRCASGHCINKNQMCDGIEQCPNGDDESNCRPVGCPPGQYLCSNNVTCIDKQNVCDGVDHCPNADDEGCCGHLCPRGTFKCGGDPVRCLDKRLLCDGVDDCGNGRDEDNCPGGCDCRPGQFRCSSTGRCINFGQFCDGTNDCPNEEDEEIPYSADGCDTYGN